MRGTMTDNLHDDHDNSDRDHCEPIGRHGV
jgi:hypothetical protein